MKSLDFPLCHGEIGKVIRIRTGREGCLSPLYSQEVRQCGAGFLIASEFPRGAQGPHKTHTLSYTNSTAFLAHMARDTHPYCGVNTLHVSGIKDLTKLMSYYYCNTRDFKNILNVDSKD